MIERGTLRAKLGAVDVDTEEFVVKCAVDEGVIDNQYGHLSGYGVRLTKAGWSRFREMQEGAHVTGSAAGGGASSGKEFSVDVSAHTTPPEALRDIWGDGHFFVFLSHKAEHKKTTSDLKKYLARFGVTCFVAHEDIEPSLEWQDAIERALRSADVLVALLTDDFRDSNWTDQEVGFALGRGIPVIAVSLPSKDPHGFMGKHQAIKGCDWSDIGGMASKIYCTLQKVSCDKTRLFDAALVAYAEADRSSDSLWKVRNILSTFPKLTREQVDRVLQAYRGNRQNRFAWDAREALIPLLEGWTSAKWEIQDDDIHEIT